jgi:mono/diheme cytochrome c family protein
MPDTTVGFDKPDTFPDFSACDQTTPELDADWKAVIHEGGRARGFSRIMPAFGELLTPIQIDAVVAYMRGFCRNAAWPRGELNLPRPLATEKAFPENEAVVTTAVGHNPSDVSNEFVYEHRLGTRNQIEISVPLVFVHDEAGSRVGGIGDVGLGFKRALFASLQSGSIFSVQGEVVAPTGNADKGLGTGTTVFEAFGAFAQLLPSNAFVQLQAGTEQPADTDAAARAVFGRVAVGKSYRQEDGLGRLWSPMLELLADREFEAGAKTNFDILPQVQVTLSRRQHVRANVGVQVPVNDRSGRTTQLLFYVLWDWFDGGLLQGWK